MPDQVAFALPTLPTSDMSRDDQGALVVNQATAVIVAAWLEHATAMVQSGVGTTTFSINSAELVGVINGVQDALRSF
jgi:hypothetical protein